MDPEITIIGFPKCGTSALVRCLEDQDDCDVLRSDNGAMEISWPGIRRLRKSPPAEKIFVHKFTAYIYNAEALEYLSGMNPSGRLVLCVRHPVKSLVSWHKMHGSIARSGNNPNHFAWKERDFYADCTIEDYYERFARRRLRYDKHITAMLNIVPKDQVVIVSQERMAQGIGDVADYLKALARHETSASLPAPLGDNVHEGYADKTRHTVSGEIREELEEVWRRVDSIIRDKDLRVCM